MEMNKTYWNNSESSLALSFPITKVNKEKRTVSGFATLDNVDRHGDIVTAEASKKAFDNFRGNIREMHGPSAVGKMINFKEDSYFDKETGKKYSGVYVTAYISKGAQDAWEKCLDGTYSGFSIGGNIIGTKMEKDESGEDRRIIHNYDLHELSLVDSPANQLANFFSIQKMAENLVTENVFWCKTDEVVSTSTTTTKDCVVCDHQMENVGWVEQSDIEKFESIEKVLDSYFAKDDAPTSSHEATESAAPGLAGNVNVIDSTVATLMYPDQNKKDKVTKSDEVSLGEGGNTMAEDTDATIEKSIDVETPAEEVSSVSETSDTTVEKAAEISEVEDTLDFEKMVSDLKAFFGESLEKSNTNYATHAATVADMYNIVNETRAEMARLSKAYEDIQKANEDLATKYETLSKSVTDMFGKIEYVDHQLKNFESATAVQKSIGVEAPMGQTKPKQSIWQGAFLSASSI